MMTLREWLEAKGMTVIEFADEIGLDHSGIYRSISGDRMPSLQVACAIEYYTRGKVKVESFLRMSPEAYIKQWRADARKSLNRKRRKRANALSRRDRETEAAQTEAA